MTVSVGVALSSRDWRGELQRHCRDHEADVVVHLLHDGRDALEQGLDVVVVDDDTSWLSAPFLTQARDEHLAVIGLFDPDEQDGFGLDHLKRVGIDSVASASLDAEALVELIRGAKPDHRLADRFDRLTAELSDRVAPTNRRVLAVGGPAGAGATEVTVALTQLCASSAVRPLLIDVDESHPSLARRLGLGLYPHLLTAVDANRREVNSFDPSAAPPGLSDCFAQTALGRADRMNLAFDVIVGLATRDDWSLVRADDVADLVQELSAQRPLVVVRLGPSLEDLTRYVDRFEVSRAAAARADHLVGVCDATSTGLLRFVDWLIDLMPLVDDAPIDVVLNRPASSAMAAQLETQLREIAGDRIGSIVVTPRDRRVERAAWDATTVDGGRFLRAIRCLVRDREYFGGERQRLVENSHPVQTS